MNCPRCAKPLARTQSRPDVELDLCAACGGAWLDRSEIYQFSMDPAELRDRIAAAYKAPKPSGLNCPKCLKELARVVDRDVEFEACPSCGGNWLDANELVILTTRPKHPAEAPPAERPSAEKTPAATKDFGASTSGRPPDAGSGVSTRPPDPANVDPKADWEISPNPRPAAETFGLLAAVVLGCAVLAAGAAFFLRKFFPQLF